MKIERLPLSIADPACGTGEILEVLREGGHIVHGADIADYGWPFMTLRDYLSEPVEMNRVGIVTNPPFKLALPFAEKAIKEAHYVAFLLRLNFLESMARLPFFLGTPPSRVWVSSRRLPMMHRLGWTGPQAPSNHAFAWFVWEQGSANTEVKWFDWRV